MTCRVELTAVARDMLLSLPDPRERRLIEKRIDRLVEQPLLQGKALSEDLAGYRSLRTAGQRFRIIYRVEKDRVVVVVVALGRRRAGGKDDIYQVARKLLKARLLE